MSLSSSADPKRRALLRLGLLLPASALLTACGGRALEAFGEGTAAAQEMQPTPACDPDGATTRAQTEGPYFTRNSPQRRSLLESEAGGTRLVLAGTVLSRQCQPLAGALLDFWQADDAGRYDNTGYRFRGHQFTDEAGRYELETVMPGLYPGRTRHFHVKVQAPNGPVLTTQLYFPDEPRNRSDGIFNPSLVMAVQDAEAGKQAAFDFVVNTA
jgi:protocatechuate 3,4-dioxygenase beta subunit